MAFTRTAGGMAEKWRFYQIPTIWVEGPTDVYFYEPMLAKLACRVEAFHGSENATALVDALLRDDYPYIVILDGDYGILSPRRSKHRRLVTLNRYSIENYLWEPEAVNRACLRHARCGENKDLVLSDMASIELHLENELLGAVIVDVAARRMPSPPKVLPERIEPLLVGQTKVQVDPARVDHLLHAVRGQLSRKALRDASTVVNRFIGRRKLLYLLKGHMVLGILRRVFLNGAAKEGGAASQITNDTLMQLLAEMVWRQRPSRDHLTLRRKVRRAVNELRTAFPSA